MDLDSGFSESTDFGSATGDAHLDQPENQQLQVYNQPATATALEPTACPSSATMMTAMQAHMEQ